MKTWFSGFISSPVMLRYFLLQLFLSESKPLLSVITIMKQSSLAVIILAAGKGTRMKSGKAKVLHELFYEPMAAHVLRNTLTLKPEQTVVVIGHQKDEVKNSLQNFSCEFAVQTEQLGTGHAVLAAESSISTETGTVMILCGDTPLIRSTTLESLFAAHKDNQSHLTLVTTVLQDPTNYGRILTDTNGDPTGIVEQKDATDQQLSINEINAGIYCVDTGFLFSALKTVGTDNNQGEVYLTDIVRKAIQAQLTVKKFKIEDPTEVLGVNSRLELSVAQQALQMRRNRQLMAEGVTMISPETIRISSESQVMEDTLIEPCVHIYDNSSVGTSSVVCQGAVIKNCTIGSNVHIGANSHLADTEIPDGAVLLPLSNR